MYIMKEKAPGTLSKGNFGKKMRIMKRKAGAGSLVSCPQNLENAGSQVGAFKTLKQAKQCADQYAGYRVYNTSGKKVYVSLKLPYKVQVKTGTIPVRSGSAKTYRRVKQISKRSF